MTLIILIFSIFYIAIILLFTIGVIFIKAPNSSKKHFISIIVAARNEEKYLENLLKILTTQNYENYEVIIANDRSTDSTQLIIENFHKRNPSRLKFVTILEESKDFIGKKNALNEAIKKSSGEILAFTDADCVPSRNWLNEINRMYEKDVDIVAGYSPLISQKNSKFLNLIKNLERSSVFAVTAGSFFWKWGITCTARNFSYRKSLFEKCNGFQSIAHIRSGDDDLMLQKISGKSHKMKFMFSQDSIVPSYDKDDIKSQISLETRRGSKWKYYTPAIKILSLLIMLYYLSLTLAAFFAIFNKEYLVLFLYSFLAKTLSEFLLIFIFLFRIKRLNQMYVFPFAELLYIPYFIFFGIKGTFGKYKWKN